MRFTKHSAVEGSHAFLSASKYHWINYDDEKLLHTFTNQFAAIMGTRKHEWAAEAIRLGRRQPRNKETLNSYINDAIGFRMEPEVVLFYSYNCFGTADTITFAKNILRVHDLKTGVHKGSQKQIFIYFALFCLEYRINPYDIQMIGRIYQLDEIDEFVGDPKEIREFMDKIVKADRMIEDLKEVSL